MNQAYQKDHAVFDLSSYVPFLGVISCEIFIPTKNGIPQNTGIFKLFKGINSKKGPGQSPPMPHPSPNKMDPTISFQSNSPL